MSFRTVFAWMTCAAALLSGCAGTGQAPVIDRSPPQQVERAAPPELKPGEYLVKKGDTLRSIALDHGQDYRDIASWNNLDNPNLIRVDQVLRIVPPGAAVESGNQVAEVRPIAPPIQIESRPVDNKPVVSDTLVKREPKGGTQPYSDEAWAQLQKPAGATQAPVPAATSPTSSKSAEVATVKAAGEVDWAWPSSNKVTGSFSEGSSKGFDFEGKSGDPVLAAAAGKVTLVTNSLRGYGNLIVVKHNANYLSVYAHNSKMLVSEGQTVNKGQKIAEVGSSDSDKPMLHFEIRREGKPVDPAKFLPQR